MMKKIIIVLSLSVFSLSAQANDNLPGKEAPQTQYYTKFVDEMTPSELEEALTGYPRCTIQTPTKAFPYNVDFVTAEGEGEQLYFLEVTPENKPKKKRILYLAKVAQIMGGYKLEYGAGLFGASWNSKASVTLHNNGVDVRIEEISSGWMGSTAKNLYKFCPTIHSM